MNIKLPDYSDPRSLLSPGIQLSMPLTGPPPPAPMTGYLRQQLVERYGSQAPAYIPSVPIPPEPLCFDDLSSKTPDFWRAEQKKQEAYIRSLGIDLINPLTSEQSAALSRLAFINEQKEISLGNQAPYEPPTVHHHQQDDGCILI